MRKKLSGLSDDELIRRTGKSLARILNRRIHEATNRVKGSTYHGKLKEEIARIKNLSHDHVILPHVWRKVIDEKEKYLDSLEG